MTDVLSTEESATAHASGNAATDKFTNAADGKNHVTYNFALDPR